MRDFLLQVFTSFPAVVLIGARWDAFAGEQATGWLSVEPGQTGAGPGEQGRGPGHRPHLPQHPQQQQGHPAAWWDRAAGDEI